jgi:hypothetical protein
VGWANINPAAQSTKEMGPGTQRDTLDDHFGDWNWKKIIKMGTLLVSCFAIELSTDTVLDKVLPL